MMLPRNPKVRIVAIAWLLVAMVLVTVTLLRPETQANDRAALSTLVPLYFMSFPLGHLGVLALGKLRLVLIVDFGVMPGIFAEGLAMGVVLTALGYAQWFVVLPWIARRCAQLARLLFKRDAAR